MTVETQFNLSTGGGSTMQAASAPGMPQQQGQRDTMEVLQRLAQLSGGARPPESWAQQLAAMTSVGPNSSVQLPPLSSGLVGHPPFGGDNAVSQALLQHYWATVLQQQQQQQQRGGSGPLAPDALLAALQAQQPQQQVEGLSLPSFQQSLAALLSPGQQQQPSLPPTSNVSQPSDALPSTSAAPRQKRNLEQLVQAAEEAGEARTARSETSGSNSSPDSKEGGEGKKGSRKRKEARAAAPEAAATKEGTVLVSEDMLGSFDTEEGGSGRLQVPLYKNAKEKNRQAQRRFRERQKGLINALKDRAHSLDKRVEEQAQTIHTLKEENNMLKLLLAEKAYAPQLMQPPQLQQPVLPHSASAQKLPGLEQPSNQQVPLDPTSADLSKA